MGAHLSRTPIFREPRTSFERSVERFVEGVPVLGCGGTEEVTFHGNAVTTRNQPCLLTICAFKAGAVGGGLVPALTRNGLNMGTRTGLYQGRGGPVRDYNLAPTTFCSRRPAEHAQASRAGPALIEWRVRSVPPGLFPSDYTCELGILIHLLVESFSPRPNLATYTEISTPQAGVWQARFPLTRRLRFTSGCPGRSPSASMPTAGSVRMWRLSHPRRGRWVIDMHG